MDGSSPDTREDVVRWLWGSDLALGAESPLQVSLEP